MVVSVVSMNSDVFATMNDITAMQSAQGGGDFVLLWKTIFLFMIIRMSSSSDDLAWACKVKKHNSDMNFYCCSAVSLFAYFFIIALFAISMLINCIQSFYVSNHQRAARFQWTNFLHIYTHRRLSRCELWVHCQLI